LTIVKVCFDVIFIGIKPKLTRFSGILNFPLPICATHWSVNVVSLFVFNKLLFPDIFRESFVEKTCKVKKFSSGACVLPYQTTSQSIVW
jgi:hypothetical protein